MQDREIRKSALPTRDFSPALKAEMREKGSAELQNQKINTAQRRFSTFTEGKMSENRLQVFDN